MRARITFSHYTHTDLRKAQPSDMIVESLGTVHAKMMGDHSESDESSEEEEEEDMEDEDDDDMEQDEEPVEEIKVSK